MSRMKSRTASALMRGMEAGTSFEPAPDDAVPPNTGNWSRQAVAGLKELSQIAKEEAAQANEKVREGIISGILPILIPVESILDEVGTDRIASPLEDTDEDGSFAALRENIRRRGLRTPLRVRPADPEWRPDRSFPHDVSGQRFVLQSGRRRLAACRELKIKPFCLVSFPEHERTTLDDLEERYYENTARKDLSAFERLYSVGLIAQASGDATQEQIAELTGIPRSTISRGLAVIEFREQLAERLDLSTASRNEIDAALKEIRDRPLAEDARNAGRRARRRQAQEDLPFKTRSTALALLRLREKTDGIRVLTIESSHLDDALIARIQAVVDRA